MSQNYSCIITKEDINIPKEIPNFKNQGVITIPLNTESLGVELFIDFFNNGDLFHPEYNKANNFIDETSPEPILHLVQSLSLEFKEFAIFHTSDWADISLDEYFACFKNGYIIEGTKHTDDEPIHQSFYQILIKLGIDASFVRVFHDYNYALTAYKSLTKRL